MKKGDIIIQYLWSNYSNLYELFRVKRCGTLIVHAWFENKGRIGRRRESFSQREDVSRYLRGFLLRSSCCKDIVPVKSVPLSASVTRKRRACASLLPLLERVSGTSSLPNKCSIDYQASVAVAASRLHRIYRVAVAANF